MIFFSIVNSFVRKEVYLLTCLLACLLPYLLTCLLASLLTYLLHETACNIEGSEKQKVKLVTFLVTFVTSFLGYIFLRNSLFSII